MPKRLEHTPTQSEAAFLEHIRTLHLPRYAELPPIDLYMDQVLTYVEEHLRPLISPEEKLLTSSMVNNYVKQHILPTPNRKRYTRDHIAYLISICLFKRTFSMGDIQKLLETQASTHTIARAYDFFCSAMEESLRTMFCGAADADRIGGMVARKGRRIRLRVAYRERRRAHPRTAHRAFRHHLRRQQDLCREMLRA